MEIKYDSYYDKAIPYKMNLDELMKRVEERGFHSEEDVLAYIRYKGKDARFFMNTVPERKITHIPFMGLAITNRSEEEKILCRVYLEEENPLYNPMIEKENPLIKNTWYNNHKIKFTPANFKGVIETYYVSDFVNHIDSGRIEIWEE